MTGRLVERDRKSCLKLFIFERCDKVLRSKSGQVEQKLSNREKAERWGNGNACPCISNPSIAWYWVQTTNVYYIFDELENKGGEERFAGKTITKQSAGRGALQDRKATLSWGDQTQQSEQGNNKATR